MNSQAKNLTKKVTIGFFIGYLLTFLLYYLAMYLTDSVALLYVWVFAQKLTYLLPLMIAAMITLSLFCIFGKKAALVALIPISLVRLIYFLPYFYLKFIYDGFDSIEAILYGLLSAIGEAALAYLLTLLLFALMLLTVKKANAGRMELDEIIFKRTGLDFSNPLSLAFAIVSLLGFSYFFISEIIDTVTNIISFSGTFTTGEIIYIVFSYLFDLALLFAYYFTLVFIKNAIVAEEE